MEEKKIEDLNKELAQCQKEKDDYLNGWKRAKADFINYKKEEIHRFEEIAKFGNENLIQELIVILDSFHLGLTVTKENKGMLLIKNQLEDLLRKHGLEKILVAKGSDFDPSRHEVVGEIDSDQPAGTIAEEVGEGYLLHSRVIRPTRVKLSKEN